MGKYVTCNNCNEKWSIGFIEKEVNEIDGFIYGFMFGVSKYHILECPACNKNDVDDKILARLRMLGSQSVDDDDWDSALDLMDSLDW